MVSTSGPARSGSWLATFLLPGPGNWAARPLLGHNGPVPTHHSQMFSWLSTQASEQFGKELATSLLSELTGLVSKSDAKFSAKAEKVLALADTRLQAFKQQERLNFYKKAKLANAFLWSLRDSGCPTEYANRLTDWLSVRL